MAVPKEEISSEYARKLRELAYLWSNPLDAFTDFDAEGLKSAHATQMLTGSDINSEEDIYVKDLVQLKAALVSACRKHLQLQDEDNGTRKRPAKNGPEPLQKAQKTLASSAPGRLLCGRSGSPENAAIPKNLRAQIESLEEETNAFLNKKLTEVDVVALPEHLPTENHNVLSLAELYYLTQTLPLIKLLPGTHKTLMTENFELALLEGKVAVLFSRIEELKRLKKWSLRQPVRYYDPFVYAKRNKKAKLHTWDYLLQEGKWMAADFKESSKFKKMCCVTMAQAVQDYWAYGKVVCVSRKPIQHLSETENDSFATDAMDVDSNDKQLGQDHASREHDQSSPVSMGESPQPETIDISKLLQRPDPADEIVPAQLPKYTSQDLANAGIDPRNRGPFKAHVDLNELKRLDQSILRNLPKFTAFDEEPRPDKRKPIPTGETSVVPVSRMLYPMESDDEWYKIVLRDSRQPARKPASSSGVPEYQKGLFGVQTHRRLNFLRPPKPPLIKNIEFRSPTIWLPQDDKLLIHYVAEYCFNWDLIAEHLQASPATLKRYESNIERRTPWQCFERYIQLNEKFQFSDMKGINAYLAQQWLEQAHKAQLTTKRRISPLGVGNESIQRGHRRLRWASMFDAIRKTMRKREIAVAKAGARKTTSLTEGSVSSSGAASSGAAPSATGSSATTSSAGAVANGTANVKRASDKTPTPSELSMLKYDRDKSMQEVYLHQQATRTKMMAAVTLQKLQSELPHPGLSPSLGGGPTDVAMGLRRVAPSQNSTPSAPSGASALSGTSSPSLQRPLPSRPVSQQLAPPMLQGSKPMGNFKRPTTPNGTPLTVEQIQRLLQIQKQRRMIQQQQQQQQQPGQQGTSAAQNPLARKAMSPGSGSGSAQMPVADVRGQGLSAGGLMTGSQSAGASMASGSGGPAKRNTAPQRGRMQFPPAQVSTIINSIQQKNPNLTKDQVTKLAASYLANLQQQQQNKLEQQAQQAQQAQLGVRPASAAAATSATQQSVQARQAQLNRQRKSGESASANPAKDADGPTLSKMQYEERKKVMMQQGGSQYGQSSSSKSTKTQLSLSSKLSGKPASRSS